MKADFMENIKIFESEKRDGIESLILNNSIAFASSITKLEMESQLNEIFKSVAKANPNQPDLLHKYAVLASIGWNGNDDVFDKEESFNARNTPLDKQVNFMHDELVIIGHMTEAFLLDENRKLIETETFQTLPDKFDIGVGFVLYTKWENKERAELIERIVSEIDSGNWFVSMECIFPNFDYAVIDKQGTHKVIARDNSTSFLSKYLKAYGGNGTYQNYRIGRLLRSFVFSGKAIVTNPANKRSLILHDNINFTSKGTLKIREERMEELDKVKSDLAAAQAEIKKLNEQAKASISSEVEGLKSEKAELAKTLATVQAEVVTLKAEVKTANDNTSKALAEAKAEKECKEKMETEVTNLKSEAAKAKRISELVKVGNEEAKAVEIYTTWASANDSQFADIVKLYTKSESSKTVEDPAEVLAKAEKEKTVASAAGDKTEETKVTSAEKIEALGKRLANYMPRAKAALQNKTQDNK